MDGGGIRGIIAAAILEALRAQIGRELHEVFDLISGTSTGGIIALGIGTKSSTSRRPDRPPVGLPLANSLATQASARWARSSAAVTSTGVVHELLVGLVASNVSSEQDQRPKRSSMSVMASAPVTTHAEELGDAHGYQHDDARQRVAPAQGLQPAEDSGVHVRGDDSEERGGDAADEIERDDGHRAAAGSYWSRALIRTPIRSLPYLEERWLDPFRAAPPILGERWRYLFRAAPRKLGERCQDLFRAAPPNLGEWGQDLFRAATCGARV